MTSRSAGSAWSRRRGWAVLVTVVVMWAVWRADIGAGSLNARGWSSARGFVEAAAQPDLSLEFLDVVIGGVLTTLGYAVVGTVLSVALGVVGGVLTSETWWRRDVQRRRRGHRPGWWTARAVAAVPRGIHEAVWALFLLQILGRDPLVAVLAIGIPFGAITAKVVADFIDDAARDPFDALRAAGAGRLAALAYAIAPIVTPDVVSYSFYRLECSLRSAVVLGMIGAGGIGYQLALSFQSLRFHEIWTSIYVLVLLSAIVDRWSSTIRNRPTLRLRRWSIMAVGALTALSVHWLELRPATLVSARTWRLGRELIDAIWPPRLPAGGWPTLWSAAVDTLALSILAIVIATTLAWPVAFLAARDGSDPPWRRLVGAMSRLVLLVTRSVPPPVWALVVVFVVYPGPLAGAIALGCYTFGVLGRLAAEVVENADPSPRRALLHLGAPRVSAFAYGTVPIVAPRFVALSLYRWEVTMRETVIVGLVGAGGLGRLLAHQNAAFDLAAMTTTVAALVLLSFTADLVSTRLRGDLR